MSMLILENFYLLYFALLLDTIPWFCDQEKLHYYQLICLVNHDHQDELVSHVIVQATLWYYLEENEKVEVTDL